MAGSPADRSGAVHIGDRILSVNSIAVSHLHHEHIVNMIKESGLTVVLTVGPPGKQNIGFLPFFETSIICRIIQRFIMYCDFCNLSAGYTNQSINQ